jgi:hypothetical protein
MHRFAKPTCAYKVHRGFESRPLRLTKTVPRKACISRILRGTFSLTQSTVSILRQSGGARRWPNDRNPVASPYGSRCHLLCFASPKSPCSASIAPCCRATSRLLAVSASITLSERKPQSLSIYCHAQPQRFPAPGQTRRRRLTNL